MATVKVNINPDGSVEPEDVGCECNKDSWPLVVMCLGFGVSFLVTLLCVLALLQLKDIVLNCYIIVLSLLGLMAELRRIIFLRKLFYHVLKFVYFLTNYYARGFYHIFLGTILFSDTPLNIIAACVSIGFGCLLIGLHIIVGMPTYMDPQMAKEIAAQRAAEVKSHLPGTTPINAASAYSPAATPTNAIDDGTASQTGSHAANPYAPPTASYGNTGTGEYVAPVAATAYMTRGGEDPYDEEPIAASRARLNNNNDDALAAAYYAQQQQAQAQAQNSRASRADPDDPFARDDSQYRPNRQ